MDRKHNKKIIPFAKSLRKHMTKEERHLWYDFLKSYPVKFLRQKTIGKYIVDFYCAEAQLIIELDGSQHFLDEHIQSDDERTAYLEEYGLRVIRIPNNEVFVHFDRVCECIDLVVKESLLHK